MYYSMKYESPLGMITVASTENAVVGLWFDGQKYFEDMGDAKATEAIRKQGFVTDEKLPSVMDTVREWLDRYFAGENPDIQGIPLAPCGSSFRQMVWQILCEIPAGQTMTYGQIAKKIAEKTGKTTMSAQAVGGAVGHNPISIIIPCHRVVGTNGSFTGYAGGIDKKIELLKLEGADTGRFFVPKRGTVL